jgi:hypothetical protein
MKASRSEVSFFCYGSEVVVDLNFLSSPLKKPRLHKVTPLLEFGYPGILVFVQF